MISIEATISSNSQKGKNIRALFDLVFMCSIDFRQGDGARVTWIVIPRGRYNGTEEVTGGGEWSSFEGGVRSNSMPESERWEFQIEGMACRLTVLKIYQSDGVGWCDFEVER